MEVEVKVTFEPAGTLFKGTLLLKEQEMEGGGGPGGGGGGGGGEVGTGVSVGIGVEVGTGVEVGGGSVGNGTPVGVGGVAQEQLGFETAPSIQRPPVQVLITTVHEYPQTAGLLGSPQRVKGEPSEQVGVQRGLRGKSTQ